MTSEFIGESYSHHPFYQCLNFMGVKIDKGCVIPLSDDNVAVYENISTFLSNMSVDHDVIAVHDVLELINLPEPSLVHWNLNHFVVLISISHEGIGVWDPYLGFHLYSCMEFMEFFNKPGYVNGAISFSKPHKDIEKKNKAKPNLDRSLRNEKLEERIVFKLFAPLAYILSRFGERYSRFSINLGVSLWDLLVRPRIFRAPQRNYMLILKIERKKARMLARRNIAELAFNMGYTNYLLHIIRKESSLIKIDKYLNLGISSGSDQLADQCIVELVHLYDPIRAVYNTIKMLPPGRDILIYGNPWGDDMFNICERVILDKNCSLEIIAPAEKMSFLKLMKRVKSGAHVIMFADGNPLFISDEVSGIQLSRSFGKCILWGRRAFMTITGAVLSDKVNANLYIGGITLDGTTSIKFKRAKNKIYKSSEMMQEKANIVQDLIDRNPEGWIFSRNAEVYFHEYHPVSSVKKYEPI